MTKRQSLGLVRECPRCGRMWSVSADPKSGGFVVSWASRPKTEKWKADTAKRDVLVSRADLLSDDFGCGYDIPARGYDPLNP